jgi:murein DD-endopeptidase MepM/ murein hydrolase activator NlpD
MDHVRGFLLWNMPKPFHSHALALLLAILAILAVSAEATAEGQGATAGPPPGFAVLASSIGDSLSVEELLRVVDAHGTREVVVDWAWITHHWPRTRWEDVARLVDTLNQRGVRVAAMYRPRLLQAPDVPTQTKADGSNALSHGYEINYYNREAREWGISWGTQILQHCPAFDEIIIYNPGNLHQGSDVDPSGGDPRLVFLREARHAWREAQPSIKVGIVTMPNVSFAVAAARECDLVHPYIRMRNDIDVSGELDAYAALRDGIGEKAGSGLAKITWETGYAVDQTRLVSLVEASSRRDIPFFFWTFDDLQDRAQYTPEQMAVALGGKETATHASAQPDGAAAGVEDRVQSMLAQLEGNTEVGRAALNGLIDLGKSDAEAGAYIVREGVRIVRAAQAPPAQRWMMCMALGKIGGSEATESLKWVMENDPDLMLRRVAAQALGVDEVPPQTPVAPQQAEPPSPEQVAALQRTLATDETDSAPPYIPLPPQEVAYTPLPWPQQAPGLDASAVQALNDSVWVINNFPLFTADDDGSMVYLHDALDIVLDNGTVIYAMKEGWVKSTSHGTLIVADESGDDPCFGWAYTHVSNILVNLGEFVKKGTPLAEIQFRGLAHLHLTRVYSEAPYWGEWVYDVAPNGFFTYRDDTPPEIKTPFHFVENRHNTPFENGATGVPHVKGDVDIVVGMFDPGAYAHRASDGFGDRHAVARMGYSIRRLGSAETDRAREFASFDFTKMTFLNAYNAPDHNKRIATTVCKHERFFDTSIRTGMRAAAYYTVTNCPTARTPQEITANLSAYAWETAAKDDSGVRLYPDGEYEVLVWAEDFKGNRSEATSKVRVDNGEV